MDRQTVRKEQIGHLVDEIVRQVHPLKIILFGSASRNAHYAGQDVDLLIVMPEGTHRRMIAQQLYINLKNVPMPFDLLVVTPSDLARNRHNRGLIYAQILAEGQELYAA